MLEPSGEKCGFSSTAGVLVIRRALPPVFEATQISPAYAKATSFALIDGWLKSLVPWAFAVELVRRIASMDPLNINFRIKLICKKFAVE
jgi:hypothetical protein